MRAGILRQNFGKFGQIVLQLFGKHIGRVDDEHAAAVHTEAVAARRMDMKLGVQIIVGSDFLSSSGSLRLSSRLRQGYQTM